MSTRPWWLLVLLAALVPVTTYGSSNDCIVLCSAGVVAAIGGAGGALVGLVVGIPIAAGDRWERFEPSDVRVSAALVPLARGVGLGLRWTP